MEKICSFLSGFKMTVLSMVFLIISACFVVFKVDTVFDPAWLTILISGVPIFYYGFKLFLTKGKMTASLLISIAMIAAICTHEVFAAAEVAFIMALGGILEDLTIDRAKQGITKLLNLAPKVARKITCGKEEIIRAEEIKKGDIIRVLAGEDIPLDGIIINGETSINQAVMTGEYTPVDKTVGDSVFSGTTNCFGVIDIEASAEYKNSSIQKLIALVKEAETKKAPTQRIVDKWASVLIPCAIIFALVVYFLTGEISRAVTSLVVFCPCSLVLATPTAIMAAIGKAAKDGIIVKTGAALETVGRCSVFAFDKTGTLTKGKMSVSSVESFGEITPENILYYAASCETKSEHPIARAIVEHALSLNYKLNETSDFKNFSGKGIYAVLDNKKINVGNEKFFEGAGFELTGEIKKRVNSKRLEGKIVLMVGVNKKIEGFIALADTIRETSREALSLLYNDKTVLLTGDNSLTAEYFAKKTGIKKVMSNLLPKEKAMKIEDMQKTGEVVCMTGDGVNDAIALKVADVGISMGTFGSDIAIESSDIIVMGDDLVKIPYLRKLSVFCIKTIKTNIICAMLINIISLIMSAMGLLVPMTGAIVHNITSLIVVLNSALLYERKI